MARQDAVKTYESVQLNTVLEESLHPGGLHLTERMAEVASLGQTSHILDVGCGRGTSILFYVRQYGCQGMGVDLSSRSIKLAFERSTLEERLGQVRFAVAGACELPCPDAEFDVVFGECTLSLVPDKSKAFDEMARVLRPGGRIVISDIALKHSLTDAFKDALGFRCCFTEALTLEEYKHLAANAGLALVLEEDHSLALKQTAFKVSRGYGSLEEFWNQFGQGRVPCCGVDVDDNAAAVGWKELFKEGKPGYWLLAWEKPDI